MQVERGAVEFERAHRHTRNVRWLKILLPAIAFLILLVLLAVFAFRSLVTAQIEIGDVSVSDGKLVMENPTLNGFDGKKRPYDLTATRAIQDVANPSRVELQEIRANLPIDEKLNASISAGTGFYDADAKTLRLGDVVEVNTNDGMTIELQDAQIDIGSGFLKTDKPIKAQSPQASISAGSMTISESGGLIVFDNKVFMVLDPAGVGE